MGFIGFRGYIGFRVQGSGFRVASWGCETSGKRNKNLTATPAEQLTNFSLAWPPAPPPCNRHCAVCSGP